MQEINQYLAQTLKQIRTQKGLSLDKTARLTGVSKAMLGQIERGESSPTVAVLWKIATGLNTSLSLFLEPVPPPSESLLIRDPNLLRQQPASDNMLVAALFPYEKNTGLEVMELTLSPDYTRVSEPHETGVTEHVIVTRGTMEVLFDGEWFELKEGQAAKFAADQTHGYRNRTDSPTVFLNVICYHR